jgi:hypothetical protein
LKTELDQSVAKILSLKYELRGLRQELDTVIAKELTVSTNLAQAQAEIARLREAVPLIKW